MPDRLPDALRELTDRQRGILTRRQALDTGLTDDMIRSRLDRGSWCRLYVGVYAGFSGPPEREARLWAAVLRAGEGAALSHYTAAELDRLTDRPSGVIHVTVPSARKVMPIAGVLLHSRRDADAATHPTRLPPRIRIEETVLDLADQSADAASAVAWVTAALGRRLTTQPKLRDALSQHSRARWRQDLDLVLSPDLAGIHSLLEYHYVRDVESPHGFPKGTRQARASQDGRYVYRDVLYDDYGLIVELDGKAAHPDETRWRDVDRDNAALASGLGTLRFGYWYVRSSPCKAATRVADALRSRGWSGLPRRCSPTCLIPRSPS